MAYVTEKRGVFYAVIYEGRNPVSGRESRRWHRCEDHAAATRLATELTDRRSRQRSTGSSLTLGEYLLGQWLPAKEATLAPSTHARNVTCIEHYLLPHLGDTPLRRLQTEHFETLYRRLAAHRQPPRRTTRREDHQEPPPDHPGGAQRRRRSGSARLEPRRRSPRARPAQASIEPQTCPLVDRGRARRLPRRYRRERPFDAVPAGCGDRDAPWRGPRSALGRRPLRHRPHRGHPGAHVDRLPPRVLEAQDPHQPPQRHRRRRHHGHARRLAANPTRRARGGRGRERTGTGVHPARRQAAPPALACPRRSSGPSAGSTWRRSGSTTCATPTPACCCATGCRSRSCPNDSGTPTRRSR